MKANKTIKEYKEKQELKIEKIVNEYSGYLYTVLKNMASKQLTEEDIEEIIADTFFVIWKKQEKLNDEIILGPYLTVIAKNLTKNLLKKKARKEKKDKCLEDYENTLPDKMDLFDIFEEQEQSKQIEKILQNMSKEDNQIFRLFYYCRKESKRYC